MKEVNKKAYKTWIEYEPNNRLKIKESINNLFTSNTLHTLEEFKKLIYDEVAAKLPKTRNS